MVQDTRRYGGSHERYTFKDVKSRSSTEYVITLMTAVKSCEQGELKFGLMIQT
jgi:hypothetical protein